MSPMKIRRLRMAIADITPRSWVIKQARYYYDILANLACTTICVMVLTLDRCLFCSANKFIYFERIYFLLIEGRLISLSFSQVGYTPLHKACQAGHKDVVQVLITLGANVNEQYKVDFSYTALKLFCSFYFLDVISTKWRYSASPCLWEGLQRYCCDVD